MSYYAKKATWNLNFRASLGNRQDPWMEETQTGRGKRKSGRERERER